MMRLFRFDDREHGEATELLPAEATFWRNLGQGLIEDGKAVEAVPALERAVALRPTGTTERVWLARAYVLADKPLEAQAQIDVLRTLDPAAVAAVRRGGPGSIDRPRR